MRRKLPALIVLLVMASLMIPAMPVVQAQSTGPCSIPQPAFCDTFDAPAGTGNRSGDLDGVVWGVSRLVGFQNFSDDWANRWSSGQITMCDGSTPTVFPPQDVRICNGQLRELTNDDSQVTRLAMYPKQPFDFAGRTGIVTFDVSNDTQGGHTFWPEFWLTNKPVPAPAIHVGDGIANPEHGLMVSFAANGPAGQYGLCPNGNNLSKPRFTVDSAEAIRSYVNSGLNVQILDCAIAPTGPNGGLNHVELRISQNTIDVYASDAGTTTMHHLAVINNANLSLTRGLIWIEDAHYDAEKMNVSGNHTFTWDNVGFDGPLLPRDLANDVPDQMLSVDATHKALGWFEQAGQIKTKTVPGVSAIDQAQAAILTFNFYHNEAPSALSYVVNGHSHTLAWPFPTTRGYIAHTLAVPVPLTEVVAGNNSVGVTGTDRAINVYNMDLILVAAGGIPDAKPKPTGTPTATSTSQPTAVPTNTSSPTSVPTQAPMATLTLTPVPQATATPGPPQTGCAFLSASGASPAFCDDQSTRASPGGRAGDLDDARWSVSRDVGISGQGDWQYWPETPAAPCKSGVTSALADNDVLLCDSGQRFETVMSAQNYGLLSMRPRQAFDFTNRTGTITYNVDSISSGNLGWWTSLYVTDDPVQGGANTTQVTGLTPKNGVGFAFDGTCSANNASLASLSDVYTFSDYAESGHHVDNAVCFRTQRGALNHIEVRLSQSNIEVWASDFSTDGGQTFPNFRRVGSVPINLNFSVGYVHYQQNERAPEKYGISPTYAQNYWSRLGFDGPVSQVERSYAVPDALTGGPPSISYGLLTNPNQMTTTAGNIQPFTLNNVDMNGVGSAKITFSIFYVQTSCCGSSTFQTKYRLNGGAWQAVQPTPEYTRALDAQAWASGQANWAMGFAFPIAASDLRQGTNTLEIGSDGSDNGWLPQLANVDLLTYGGELPTATPMATSTPTSTPMSTATSTLVPTQTPVPTATPGTQFAQNLQTGDSIQVNCSGTLSTVSQSPLVLACN